jgi:hypothetical protein
MMLSVRRQGLAVLKLFRLFAILAGVMVFSSERASAQVAVSSGVASGIVYGPTVGPWFGPYYGPGLWGWNGPWGFGSAYGWGWGGAGWTMFPGVPLFGMTGINPYGLPIPSVGPTPGNFSMTGGYGIGGGVYGAGRDLPTVVPTGNGPRFATRDVKRHWEGVRANPQAAINRAYYDRYRFGRW